VRNRPLTILCVAYVALVVYASLMPFDFSPDLGQAAERYQRAWRFWPFGRRLHTSRADLAANFAVYVPMGLLIATRIAARRGARRGRAFIGALAVSAGTSIAVEAAQLLSVERISGAHDVLMNTAGGIAGGALGALLGRRGWVYLRRALRGRWRARPLVLAAAALLVLLAADALFPLRPTLDVSTVARNLRDSRLSLAAGWAEHPWHHWLVRRGAVYAVLAGLLAGSSRGGRGARCIRGGLLAVAFALVAEFLKLFIVSRCANVTNPAVSAGGAVCGAFLFAALAGRLSPRRGAMLAAGLLLGYIAYVEWEPFAFAWDTPAVRARLPSGPAWLPLYHYAVSGRPNDVRLFVRTLSLLAALACACRLAWPRLGAGRWWARATVAALLGAELGLLLEFGQLALPARVPSVTDVFCFALGAAIGAAGPLPRARPA